MHVDGVVVKLDRGYPLVQLCSGADAGTGEHKAVRCEHATALVKENRVRAVIGDRVNVLVSAGHDKGIIEQIYPRSTQLVRRDPADRTAQQVLAANFTLVIIAEPVAHMNVRWLERALVLAHQTGARVMVALTKSDLLSAGETAAVVQRVRDVAGAQVDVLAVSVGDTASIERIRGHVAAGETAVLIGKSGAGKSSLVNALAGRAVQAIASVREADGKGRHTTVDRVLVDVAGGGQVMDMPGVRGLGIWDAREGLQRAFGDVAELAQKCRFRDCTHTKEPGCAVRAAVDAGVLHPARLESYRALEREYAQAQRERVQAERMRGEKHSKR